MLSDVMKEWGEQVKRLYAMTIQHPHVPIRYVFSQTRTGTVSIALSLQSANLPVIIRHFVGVPSIRYTRVVCTYVDTPAGPLLRDHFYYPLFSIFKRWNRPIQIFTSVRDPIARELSSFMCALSTRPIGMCVNDAISAFRHAHLLTDRTITWFDEAFAPEIGLNIFDYPFDKTTGYGAITADQFSVFIVKAESVRDPSKRREIARALSIFTGAEISDMVTSGLNDAKYRENYHLYREIVDNYIADDVYLDRVYNSRYMRHFYTDEEIAAFRTKWTHKPLKNL